MNTMELTDIHCHILSGMDDGAKNAEESLALLRLQKEQGVSKLVFTPHFYPEQESDALFLERRTRAMEEMEQLLRENGLEMEVRAGAEIQFTPMLDQMSLESLCFSGTRYLLLELNPLFEPIDVEGMIRRLRKRGFVPVLAHIERFPYIEDDPTLLWQWVRAGALAQINAGAVRHSKQTRKRLEQYDKWGLVHLMASDSHSADRRPPNLANGYQCLHPEMAQRLMKNAELLFRDQEIGIEPPRKPVRRFGMWR